MESPTRQFPPVGEKSAPVITPELLLKIHHYTRLTANIFFSRKLDFNFINALKNFYDPQVRSRGIYWEEGCKIFD
jgi:hypothetical protein